MSFGKKYFSSYKSNNGLDYYLELFVANFSGTATEIVLGKGGPVITYETDQEDRFSPILSSQCELPFLVQNTSHQDFIEELRTTFQERQIYLHLYRASSSTYSGTKPLWSGFMVMDLGAGEDVSFPYEQKLTFVDGLALLKDIDFVDLSNEDFEDRVMGNYAQENMYFGPAVYTFWIKEILLKAGCATTSQGSTQDYGFTTAINWYNGAMPNTNQNFDPFGNTKCVVSMFHTKNDQQVFTPENCYTVLKELLRHWGARITYWKHEFWIVQIPEYIQDETGLIDNPNNINTRQYNKSGTQLSSQDHLGDTFFTRYEQTVGPNQISKLVGTKYNYLPITHRASADFLSFASKNYYGGFPFGTNATSQEIFQGTIIDPSSANFLFLSIPLNWVWDLSNSNIIEHTGGWWCSIKFNFYATNIDSLGNITEYYLQYEQTTGTYYWVLKADWSPIVKSPKYVIKSRRNVETNYIGFQEQIPFVDASGNAITMNGAWSFFLDIEDYATQNGGSFFCRFSGYNNFSGTVIQRNPQVHILLPNPSGSGTTPSGTVSWSNTLQDPSQILVPSTSVPVTFNAGTAQPDIQLVTNSAFVGFLQTLNTTQNASYGNQVVTTINNSNNTEMHDFGTLIWGDAVLQATIGALRVNNGSTYIKTNPAGEWGRGTLSGAKTFTELLIDEFLSGQVKVVISPTMRLIVSESLKNQTSTGSSGPATRPRFVNPIGRLRETRSNETDPEYIFRRGSFFTLQDEWDYEGYQIIRDTVTATTTTNDLGGLGGAQDDAPLSNARMQGPVTNALMQNAPVAYLRTTVASTGSNVSVNGNFNVATGWTLGTGWSIDTTISKAKFTATGSTSDLIQDVLELEKTYKISFRVEVTAGTLTVKAGTTGGSQSITSSGDYIIYKQCLGNTQIKFQAGTTFTGTVTFVRIEEQKSLSQVPIEPLDSAVFKSGDTFNLINSNSGEIMELNVTSNQSAGDTVINVTSTALFDDIDIGSIVLINQDDLAAQYQNKTKGTVGGFDITATSIDSGSVAISSYIDDDSFGTASATSLATSESIKAYVDGQVSATDSLQEVTTVGNTTTNSIMIGSSSSPSHKLQVISGDNVGTTEIISAYALSQSQRVSLGYNSIVGSFSLAIKTLATQPITFHPNNSEAMRLTSGGKLLIGGTSEVGTSRLVVDSGSDNLVATFRSAGDSIAEIRIVDSSNYTRLLSVGSQFKIMPNDGVEVLVLDGNNNTATFSGQVTIPATPVASTDAASKGYVDAQIGANNDLQEVTDNGNTTTNSIMIGSSSSPSHKLNVSSSNDSTAVGIDIGSNASFDFAANSTSGYSTLFYMDNVGLDIGHDSTARAINFKTGGSDKVTITGGGNVGIGASSPSEILNLAGNNPNIRIDDTSAASRSELNSDLSWYDSTGAKGGFIGYFQSANLEIRSTAGDVSIGTFAGTQIYIDGANTGFGTLTPSEKIHVVGDALITGDSMADAFKPAASGEPIKFKNFGSTELARITDGGNFGISTVNPLANLQLGSFGTANQEFRIESDGNSYFSISTTNGVQKIYAGGAGTQSNEMAFYTSSSGTESERMRLTSGGRLGIGTTNPLATLHVLGSAAVSSYIYMGTTQRISWGNGNQEISATNDAQIEFKTGGSEKMRLTSGGNLLIGTTTDSAKLTVDETTTNNLTVAHFKHNQGGVISNLLLENSAGANDTGFSFDFRLASSGTSAKIGAIRTNSPGAGDTDMFFSTSTNGTSVSEAMRLTSGGNVLIGTTTDDGSSKLQVAGTVKIINGSGNVAFSSSSSGDLTVTAGDDIRLDAGGNDIVLRSSGTEFSRLSRNSGLEITSSETNADINLIPNGTGTVNVHKNLLIGTTTDDGSSKLQVNGDVKISSEKFLHLGSNANGFGSNSNSSPIIRSNNGNIFFDSNSSDNINIYLQPNGGQIGDTAKIHFNSRAVVGWFNSAVYLGDNGQNKDIKLQVNSSDIIGLTSNTERFRIKSGGNFLIGTTTDSGDKLQVNGNVKAVRVISDILRDTNENGHLVTTVTNASNTVTSVGNLATANSLTLGVKSAGAVNIPNGNMSVGGTAGAVYKLDVVGKQRVQSVLELEDVLTLNAISTPSDPANNKSSIYMDSADGAIKVKINVGGTVVTRTIASFE